MEAKNYLVSIRLMTFNHEPYIRQAMEGIMMQEANFNIEVVIGDDFSSDRTLDIVKEFESTENIHIKILNRAIGDNYWEERNKYGRLYNFFNIINNCSGKYVALLDGDDYWTDPLKLQKQVDFLENNFEYIISFHDTKVIDEFGTLISESRLKNLNSVREQHELVGGALLPTCTVLFRNQLTFSPENYKMVQNGDTFLWAVLGQHGKGYFNKNVKPSVYRKHSRGIWSLTSRTKKLKASYQTFFSIYKLVEPQYKRIVLRKSLGRSYKLFKENLFYSYKDSAYWFIVTIKHLITYFRLSL